MTHLPPPMDFLTFTVLADQVAKANPDWRRGQSYFNALFEVRPELADEIRGRHQDLDPFYRDENIDAFLAWAGEQWSR